MRDDPDFNVKFCEVVAKYPCIYDYTRSDYNNRANQEQAWRKVGEYLKERAADCKDRWRNIRGRYVKCKNQINLPSGSGAKRIKEYYLTPHLHFLDSFLKSRKSKGSIVDEKPATREAVESSIHEKQDKDNEKSDEEFLNGGKDEYELDMLPTSSPDVDQVIKSQSPHDSAYRKRKIAKTLTDVYEQAFKYFKKKEKFLEKRNTAHKTKPLDPDMAYMLSLLPDIKTMDAKTKRKFKMGVLHMVDQLLNPISPDCSSSYCSDYPAFHTTENQNQNTEVNDSFSIDNYVTL